MKDDLENIAQELGTSVDELLGTLEKNMRRVSGMRKSESGKYKVLGIDKFSGEDWIQGEYDTAKEALQEAAGDMEKAVDFLRKKGLATALKRAGRETSEGLVHSYIHTGGKIGVLVEVNCETDFVAKTDEFNTFVKNLAMHIAAAKPLGIRREDVPEQVIQREEEIYRAQAIEMGKPEKILDKIVGL